jgi:CheY-like chemotaxis protein
MTRDTILLVEDDADEIHLMKKAFSKGGLNHPLQIITHGGEVIPYFEGKGAYADRVQYPLPGLMFLDLKLPGISGLYLLAWIKGNPEFRHIPVVVFTSSDDPDDLRRAYQFGANSYLIKPMAFDDFVDMLKVTGTYWISMNSTPTTVRRRKPARAAAKNKV